MWGYSMATLGYKNIGTYVKTHFTTKVPNFSHNT
jgi:hypothetical protein